MTDKKSSKIAKLEDKIKQSKNIKKEHKEEALNKVREWYIEDKAEGILAEEMLKITKEFTPILEEIGLI